MLSNQGIKVLSYFDGISCGRVALERAGISVSCYHAAEIDRYAIKISMKNYPDILHLGDVMDLDLDQLPEYDLFLAGFPCQAYSIAGKMGGLEDIRGQLIFPMLKAIEKIRPKNLLLENVKGFLAPKNKPVYDLLMNTLKDLGYNITCKVVNSSLVSAQNRERVYFTSWDYPLPEDRGITLGEIIESGVVDREKSYCLDANYYKGGNPKSYFESGRRQLVFEVKGAALRNQVTKRGVESQLNIRKDDKSNCLVASYSEKLNGMVYRASSLVRLGEATDIKGSESQKRVYSVAGKALTLAAHSGGNLEPKIGVDEWVYRSLSVLECERLQGLPDNYTEGVSKTQRYKTIGNGWSVDTVSHILEYLPVCQS